jgi:DNA-nicking Smr family endonuclease
MSRRSRAASPEETRLWRSAMRDVTPMHDLPPLPETPPPAAGPLAPPAPAAVLPPPAARRPNGIDGHSLKQLSKGQRPVEATIDLHGMTAEMAHAALRRFIAAQAQAERRCLLVITGKGKADQPGRLKREVPLWLADWRPPVLAVVPAAPRHGGGGAFYVLLQRRR